MGCECAWSDPGRVSDITAARAADEAIETRSDHERGMKRKRHAPAWGAWRPRVATRDRRNAKARDIDRHGGGKHHRGYEVQRVKRVPVDGGGKGRCTAILAGDAAVTLRGHVIDVLVSRFGGSWRGCAAIGLGRLGAAVVDLRRVVLRVARMRQHHHRRTDLAAAQRQLHGEERDHEMAENRTHGRIVWPGMRDCQRPSPGFKPFRTLRVPEGAFLAQKRVQAATRVDAVVTARNVTSCMMLIGSALALLLCGCSSGTVGLEQFGAMRPVMRDGRTEPRADLASIVSRPAMYGVGAMAGLDGEVTIRDGEVWITRVRDGAPCTTGPEVTHDGQATLLTVGPMRSVREHTLNQALAGSSLEEAIRSAAASDGLDATLPFLFTLRGTATALELHVVDGTCMHVDPKAPGLRIVIAEPTPVEIVGVHAEGQAGVMTHHGTSVHMHALLLWKGHRVTAHVDSITMAPGSSLRIPKDASRG